MKVERWRQIEDLLDAALERPPSDRATLLDCVCGADADLRNEVESLLAHQAPAENFIETSAFMLAAEILAADEDEGQFKDRQIGPYRIIREIGRGGMGAVFLAERSDGEFQQQVALKVIRQSFADPRIERRFRSERQILASLNHPNIARLLDGGVGEWGEPFLVMEYVEGTPLLDFAENASLSLEERLKLFQKICHAVSFAHRNLIVHRDIKPSNILVTPEGEPKLLDFGLAKVLDESFALNPTQTETAFRAFTPAYASPEQISGHNVTTASDIYSLGVVLYELLTGKRPFNFEGKNLEQIIKSVTEMDPCSPSRALWPGATKLAQNGAARRKKRSDASHLEGDIDNLVLMALRKEPERRYKSVEAFAEDIQHYLEGWPIAARPNTLGYRAGKFVTRNTLGITAASLICLSIVTGIVATVRQARKASQEAQIAAVERDRARGEADKAGQLSSFLQSMMLTASPNWNSPGFGSSNEVTLIEVIDDAARRVNTEFAGQPESLAKIQHNLGLIYTFRGRYEEGESQLRAAYELSGRLYGEENPEALQNTRDLAGLLMLKGEYDQSAALYQKALIIYRKRIEQGKTEGNTLLGFAGTLSDVGFLHRLRGEPKISEMFLNESLQQSAKFVGSDRAVVAIPLSHLGMARYEQGDLESAEKYVRDSIDEFRRLPGKLRVEIGRSLLNFGKILVAKGDYKQAEVQIRECLELYHQRLGDKHPYNVLALSDLGDLQYLTGDYARAEENIVRALELSRQTLPKNHPNMAYPLNTMGLILTKRGKFSAGEKYLCEALGIQMRVMNQDSWLIAETEGALGECLRRQRRFQEAEPLLLRSYESLKLSQAKESARTLSARNRLAELYKNWNKPELYANYR